MQCVFLCRTSRALIFRKARLVFLFRFGGFAGGFTRSVLAGRQGVGAFEGFIERAKIGKSGGFGDGLNGLIGFTQQLCGAIQAHIQKQRRGRLIRVLTQKRVEMLFREVELFGDGRGAAAGVAVMCGDIIQHLLNTRVLCQCALRVQLAQAFLKRDIELFGKHSAVV